MQFAIGKDPQFSLDGIIHPHRIGVDFDAHLVIDRGKSPVTSFLTGQCNSKGNRSSLM
jgi:hypothetical protein